MSQDLTLGINTTEGECERGSSMVLRVAISRLKSILRWWWGRGGGEGKGVFTGSSLRWFLSVLIQTKSFCIGLFWNEAFQKVWNEVACLFMVKNIINKQPHLIPISKVPTEEAKSGTGYF